jgi:hypothetical protein
VFCVDEIEGRRDLMCVHHTAMFHLDDGHCYDGPCKGERLLAVDVAVEDRAIFVERACTGHYGSRCRLGPARYFSSQLLCAAHPLASYFPDTPP